jgi:hypothetical protein
MVGSANFYHNDRPWLFRKVEKFKFIEIFTDKHCQNIGSRGCTEKYRAIEQQILPLHASFLDFVIRYHGDCACSCSVDRWLVLE